MDDRSTGYGDAYGYADTTEAAARFLHSEATTAQDELQFLGRRARLRRDEIGLSRAEVALHLGVTESTLFKWENVMMAHPRACEQTWERILKVPAGWLRDSSMLASEVPITPPTKWLKGARAKKRCDSKHAPVLRRSVDKTVVVPSCATVAEEIFAICCWFSRRPSAPRTFDYGQLNATERRIADIAAHRFGLYGEDCSTLQSIGDLYGLTRERIRQLSEKVVMRMQLQRLKSPQTDKFIKKAGQSLPRLASELTNIYESTLGMKLTVFGVQRFVLQSTGGAAFNMAGTETLTMMVMPPEGVATEDLRDIGKAVRSLAAYAGAVHIDIVKGGLQINGSAAEEAARQAPAWCAALPGFSWLDEKNGWFWLGPNNENRVRVVVARLLSVADRVITPQDVHDALARMSKKNLVADTKGYELKNAPAEVIARIMRALPELHEVKPLKFAATRNVDSGLVLTRIELETIAEIRRRGGVATRLEISRHVIKTLGVSAPGVNLVVDKSPVIVKLRKNAYGVRATGKSDLLLTASI